MPSVRQLEYLLAIAETRHFRRAAERVNTTQPTLSGQLKALEDRLGAQLVERTRSRVVLTPIGVEVAETARRVLRDVQNIRDLCARQGDGMAGVMRLGVPPTVCPYLLPRVVPDLHKSYPALKLYAREDLPQPLLRGLDDGSHDAIIMPLPIQGADFKTVELYREPLLLAVPSDHRLAKKGVVQSADLANEDVLTLGPAYQLHTIVVSLCEELGARVRYDYEGTSLDTLREMVSVGLGVTFLPSLYVRSVLTRDPSIKVLEIRGRAVYRTIGMAWRRSSARQDAFGAIADVIRRIVLAELAVDWRTFANTQ